MNDFDPQPKKRSPAVWIGLGCGLFAALGLCCGGGFVAWTMYAQSAPVLPFIYTL